MSAGNLILIVSFFIILSIIAAFFFPSYDKKSGIVTSYRYEDMTFPEINNLDRNNVEIINSTAQYITGSINKINIK